MHATKVFAKKMGEGVGMKNKESPAYSEEVVTKKDTLLQNVKTLNAMLKHMDDVKKTYLTFGKGIDGTRPILDEVKAPFRTELYGTILTAISEVPAAIAGFETPDLVQAKETIKAFIRKCDAATGFEYKKYNDMRVEYELALSKMGKAANDDKRDERERKLENAQEGYEVAKKVVLESYNTLLHCLPDIYEITTLAICEYHNAFRAQFGKHGDELKSISLENRDKMTADFGTLDLGNKGAASVPSAPAEQELVIE